MVLVADGDRCHPEGRQVEDEPPAGVEPLSTDGTPGGIAVEGDVMQLGLTVVDERRRRSLRRSRSVRLTNVSSGRPVWSSNELFAAATVHVVVLPLRGSRRGVQFCVSLTAPWAWTNATGRWSVG